MKVLRFGCVVALCVATWACSIERHGLEPGPRPRDAGPADANPADAGAVDSGERDARASDAGMMDAGNIDGGLPDAGPEPDGGPPDCRDTPESCEAPGLGAACDGADSCWPELTCCQDSHCGGDEEIGGVCTVSCDGDDACPLDMLCEHGVCWFPCADGSCPNENMVCQHDGRVCEWN